MTLRAQNKLIVQLGRLPSAVELYQAQWPDDKVQLPADLQAALDNTSKLMAPAFAAVIDSLPNITQTMGANDNPVSPPPDISKPVPPKGTETFASKAPRIMEKLISDFGLKDFQAAGVLGNIGEECDGFREMQERRPLVPGSKGGFGWAQWTGARRTQFELFCDSMGLSPFSDPANYGFLKLELNTTQAMALRAVQKATSLSEAVRSFEATFERAKAGLEHFDRRDDWANLALKSFRESSDSRVPSAVAKILDPDLTYRVLAKAIAGNATYWVIDQFNDEGGQALVKQESGQDPVILASDTSIFPLKPGLVIPSVAAQLSASFNSTVNPPSRIVMPRVPKSQVNIRIFAKAKECDETLVTRDVPNTNHGHLACAYAVNEVVRRAVGKPIGGGLSTAEMGEILASTQTALPVQISPGMIIISPTHGGNVGHVGIIGEVRNPVTATVIYSNSSNRGVFSHAFTLGKWKSFYRDHKGLPIFFYALKL
jgi:hypothetical protein